MFIGIAEAPVCATAVVQNTFFFTKKNSHNECFSVIFGIAEAPFCATVIVIMHTRNLKNNCFPTEAPTYLFRYSCVYVFLRSLLCLSSYANQDLLMFDPYMRPSTCLFIYLLACSTPRLKKRQVQQELVSG